jgi:hypothetical protein
MEEEFLEAELQLAKMLDISEDRIAKAKEDFKESGLRGFGLTLTEPIESKPIGKALHLLMLGNKDEAFAWLAKSWELPLWGYENAPSNRLLDPIRDDPRFAELLRKQKLPEEVIQRHLSLGR